MEPYPSAIEDVPAKIIYMGKDVRKYGMMKKKSGGRKIPVFQGLYDSRLVIINKGWVYYYKDKTSEKPQGKFSLQGFSSTVINAEEEEATMPFVFKVYSKKANERTWYFATDTKLDMEQWMEAFRLEIEQYNMKGIPNIRPSKSCPVNPHSDLSRPDINNGRPQSVHTTATPMPNHLSVSQFSSRTDVTSGIGSSTHSIDTPDDLYEPVEDYIYDNEVDEFETDSEAEDYEQPLAEPAPPTSVYPSLETTFYRTGSPPALPPRDPVQSPTPISSQSSQSHPDLFAEMKAKMTFPPREEVSSVAPFSKPAPNPHHRSPPQMDRGLPPRPVSRFEYPETKVANTQHEKVSFQIHASQLSSFPKPFLSTPVFPRHPEPSVTRRPLPGTPETPPPPSRPAPSLPHSRPTPESCLPPKHFVQSSGNPIHMRHKSEDSLGGREHAVSLAQKKRHSSPFGLMHDRFAEELSSKLGQPASTSSSRAPDTRQRPWSMAPKTSVNLDGGEPGYPSNYPPTVTSPHRQFSPFDRRALPPVLEPRGQVGGPQDLPPRPPPAPPAESVGKNYHRENPSLTNQFHSSPGVNKPYEVGAQSLPSSTGAEKQKGFIPPPRKQFSPRPPHMSSAIPPPMLPPKPSTPKDPSKNSQVGFSMPAFKPELHDEQYYSDNYNDTGQAEYDDNVEGNSEDQSYEEPYSESETIDEIIYEDEPQVHKSPPPTPPVKPGKKPATSPPPVAMKPATKFASATDSKADHKPVGSSTSWQPVLKSPNAGPTSVGKLRSHTSSSPNVPFGKPSSTSSRPQEEDDNRPSWMRTKLKTVDESKVTSKPARAVSEADTGHKPPWVKDKPSVTAQKPAPLSKLPWQRDAPQPNNKFVKHVIPSKDASANFSNLNPTTRPHVALKPTGLKQKPAVGSKPAPPQKPNTQTQVADAQHIKPPAPLQTHKPAVPGAKPSTHLTKLRDRFNQ